MDSPKTSYILLEKSLSETTGIDLSFDSSKPPTTITDGLSLIVVLAFSTIFVLGMLRVVYAGILSMEADSANKRNEVKDVLKRVVMGTVGVLMMWLFLSWINLDMLRANLGIKSLSSSSSSADQARINIPENDAVMRSTLKQLGILVNHDNCTPSKILNKEPCTSLDKLGSPVPVIKLLQRLKTGCSKINKDCVVVITGGTEPGHITHGPNKAIIDLRCAHTSNGCGSDPMSTYIRENGSDKKTTNTCYEKYSLHGFYFCDENINGNTPHWHVSEYQ